MCLGFTESWCFLSDLDRFWWHLQRKAEIWLNDVSVEVFIWDSESCLQWTWIITSCPHLSQQHINGDDNLNVSMGNYFIPCARKQRESSQPSSFPVSEAVWGKSPFGVTISCSHTHTLLQGRRITGGRAFHLSEWIWLSTSLCHCK